MPGFIAPWREAVSSPRLLLPTVDASGHARCCSAGRPRLLLHAAWGASVLLVGLLLFSQVQIIPRGISRHAIVPIDELTRLLPMSLVRPASSAPAAAADRPRESASSGDGSYAGHIAAADLESLWSILDFTQAVRAEPAEPGPDDSNDLALPQPQAAGSPLQHASSSSSSATWPVQPLLAPLEPPALAQPSQHDIQLMAGIVKETIRARITAAEARAGFISAFEGMVPPPGIHRWQVKPPHEQLQGWQHMGAEQLQADAGAISAAAADDNNNDSDDSAAAEQQATGYEEEDAADASDEYTAAGDTPNDAADASEAGSSDPAAAPPATSEQQRGQLAQSAAEHLMTYALLLLKGSRRLAPCGSDDDSLPLPLPEVPGGPPGGRLLLAAALNGDEEEAMPNLVLQLLLFAVQASPGSLYISIYESGGSTGATSYWLDVLRLLLVPLRVPAHIVTGGDLIHRPGQSRVEFIASVRNAAIEPFFNTTAAAAAGCPLIDQPASSSGNGLLKATLAQQQQQQVITTANAQPSSAGQQQPANVLQPDPAASWQQRMLLQLQQRSVRQRPAAAAPSSQARPGRRLAYSFAAPFWLPDVFGASANATPPAPAASPAPATGALASEQLMVPAAAPPATQPELAGVQLALPVQAVVSSSSVAGPSQPACYQPDNVMFLDGSIFFCKSDLQRMLLHRQADMACGWSLHMPSSSSAADAAANGTVSNGSSSSSSSSAELANASSDAPLAETLNAGAQPGLAAQAGGVFPPPFAARRQLLQESPLTSEQFLQQQQLLQQQQQELLLQQQQLLKQQQLLQQQQELFKQQQLLQQQQERIKQQQEENQELLAQVLGEAAGSQGSIQEHLTQLVQSAATLQPPWQPSSLAGADTSSGSSAAGAQLPSLVGDASWPGKQHEQQPQEQQQEEEQLLPEEAYAEEEGLEDEPQLPAVLERPSATELSRFPFGYSDAAVGRMVNGQLFDVAPYYAASHPPTVRRLTAGLPVQVYCCWSGLVKLRAEPFRRGLRFRGHQPGECRGRETSLLCDDLHRLNFSRVLVDSGVLVSRQLELTKKISTNVRHAKRMPYIRRSRWIEVTGGGSPWVMSPQQLRRGTYANVTCCDEQEERTPALGGGSLGSASTASRQLTQQLVGSGNPSSRPGVADIGLAPLSRRLSATADMTMHSWLAAATLPVDQQQASLLGSWGGQCRRVNVMARNHTRDFLLGVGQV